MDNAKVGVYPVEPMPAWPLPTTVIRLVFKAVWQSFSLFRVLAYRAPPAKWIIVQVRLCNPTRLGDLDNSKSLLLICTGRYRDSH